MKTKIDNITLQQEAWYKTWFDSAYYPKLYQSRNEQEASGFIDKLIEFLQPANDARMLDLACGSGRHSKYLAQLGFDVTGLDLAGSSIRHAKKCETPSLRFRQHDMRNAFGTNEFNFIFNFFTSFGYFEDKDENAKVVENLARALKPNGLVVFDYLNVSYAEKNLAPVEEKEIDGIVYHINRWCTDAFFYKRIAVQDASMVQPQVYIEKVARFSQADFEQFFALHGLQTIQLSGDYDLRPYDAASSKRLILVAKKSSTC